MRGNVDYPFFRRLARLSNWYQRRCTPMGHALSVLTLGAAVFATDPTRSQATILLAALLALFLVAALDRRRVIRALGVTREIAEYAQVATPLNYRIVLTLPPGSSLHGVVLRDHLREQAPTRAEVASFSANFDFAHDNWFDRRSGFLRWWRARRYRMGGEIKPVCLATLDDGRHIISLELLPSRRGNLSLSHIELACPDVTGLLFRVKYFSAPQHVLVTPRCHALPALSVPACANPLGVARPLAGNQVGQQEFHSLRDYRFGDSLRHIHWRASAKRGEPIVKQYSDGSLSPFVLVLDFVAEPIAFEALLETASSLAFAAVRDGLGVPALAAVGAREGCQLQHFDTLTALDARLAVSSPNRHADFTSSVSRLALDARQIAVFVTCHNDVARLAFAQTLLRRHRHVAMMILSEATVTPALPLPCHVISPRQLAESLARLDLFKGAQ